MTHLLVAASSSITNEVWIERCLTASLPQSIVDLTQFGESKALSSVLSKLNLSSEIVARGLASERRSEIRRALTRTDHLLLLWDGRSLTQLLFEARLRSQPTKIHAIEVTTVANRDRGDDFDVYIGRGTPWGNPYPVGKLEGQYERDEAIELFRGHFRENILSDPALCRGLFGLRGLRLACHCKPLACHGDVIAEYLNALDPDEVSSGPESHTEAGGGTEHRRRAA